MSLDAGGHLTHEHKVNFSGKLSWKYLDLKYYLQTN
jgi:glycine/serine hydroxymethyltransferase